MRAISHYGIPSNALLDNILGRWYHDWKWRRIARKSKKQNQASREFVPPRIDFLGVWDTVATFGVPKNILGIPFQRINLFKNFDVGASVERAVHLVSIDERRDAFQPTLMNETDPERIHQVWFAGIHCNIGGGYAFMEDGQIRKRPPDDSNFREGLSNVTFEYMMSELKQVLLDDVVMKPGSVWRTWQECLRDPIRNADGPLYAVQNRRIPEDGKIHWTAIERLLTVLPALDVYRPPAIDSLLARLSEREDLANKRVAAVCELNDEKKQALMGTLPLTKQDVLLRIQERNNLQIDVTGLAEDIDRREEFNRQVYSHDDSG